MKVSRIRHSKIIQKIKVIISPQKKIFVKVIQWMKF